MTELEKMAAGLEYDYTDPEVSSVKVKAVEGCARLESISVTETAAREEAVRALFGSVGMAPRVYPGFHCDIGTNIHAGNELLINYNVTILDRAPVTIGDHVMIGPNTMISAVGHPFSPKGRRGHLSVAQPVTIGDDVWIGGNCAILPGVTIGRNVVVAAGAVVTQDVPDNCLVGGVPAKIIRSIENDL